MKSVEQEPIQTDANLAKAEDKPQPQPQEQHPRPPSDGNCSVTGLVVGLIFFILVSIGLAIGLGVAAHKYKDKKDENKAYKRMIETYATYAPMPNYTYPNNANNTPSNPIIPKDNPSNPTKICKGWRNRICF